MARQPGLTLRTPIRSTLLSRMTQRYIRSIKGRHKLYASCLHPLLNRIEGSNPTRVDEEALLAGNPVFLYRPTAPEMVILPEPEFWEVIRTFALDNKMSLRRAFMVLVGRTVDTQSSPPHPLLRFRYSYETAPAQA